MVLCCVVNCKNTSKEEILHTLPKDDEVSVAGLYKNLNFYNLVINQKINRLLFQLRRKWCVAIRREDLIDIDLSKRSRYRVCDIHFAKNTKFPTNRNRTNLKAGSYPTFNLPGKLYLRGFYIL